jgi:hypothetical protein
LSRDHGLEHAWVGGQGLVVGHEIHLAAIRRSDLGDFG